MKITAIEYGLIAAIALVGVAALFNRSADADNGNTGFEACTVDGDGQVILKQRNGVFKPGGDSWFVTQGALGGKVCAAGYSNGIPSGPLVPFKPEAF